jgi:hypothetical protein
VAKLFYFRNGFYSIFTYCGERPRDIYDQTDIDDQPKVIETFEEDFLDKEREILNLLAEVEKALLITDPERLAKEVESRLSSIETRLALAGRDSETFGGSRYDLFLRQLEDLKREIGNPEYLLKDPQLESLEKDLVIYETARSTAAAAKAEKEAEEDRRQKAVEAEGGLADFSVTVGLFSGPNNSEFAYAWVFTPDGNEHLPDEPWIRWKLGEKPRNGDHLKWHRVKKDELAVRWKSDAGGHRLEILRPAQVEELTFCQVIRLKGILGEIESWARSRPKIEGFKEIEEKFLQRQEAVQRALVKREEKWKYFGMDFYKVFSSLGQKDEGPKIYKTSLGDPEIEVDGSMVWLLESETVADGRLEIILRRFVGGRDDGKEGQFIRWRKTEDVQATESEETKKDSGVVPDISALLSRFGQSAGASREKKKKK